MLIETVRPKIHLSRMLCGLALALALAPLVAAASPARAWLVTKGEASAVLVGESHLYSKLEFNGELDTVVVPAFDAAAKVLAEAYVGPQRRPERNEFRGKMCEHEQERRKTDALIPAMSALVASAKVAGIDLMPGAAHYHEVGGNLLATTIIRKIGVDSAPAYVATLKKENIRFLGVSTHLMERARDRKQLAKMNGLDFQDDYWATYCRATPVEQQEYLVSLINQVIKRMPMYGAPNGALIKRDLAVADVLLSNTLACIDRVPRCARPGLDKPTAEEKIVQDAGLMPEFSNGAFAISIANRNLVWMSTIREALRSPGNTFIIVGAMHLPSYSLKPGTALGLIDLLRQEGYAVTPIRSAGELAPFLKNAFSLKRLLRQILGDKNFLP